MINLWSTYIRTGCAACDGRLSWFWFACNTARSHLSWLIKVFLLLSKNFFTNIVVFDSLVENVSTNFEYYKHVSKCDTESVISHLSAFKPRKLWKLSSEILKIGYTSSNVHFKTDFNPTTPIHSFDIMFLTWFLPHTLQHSIYLCQNVKTALLTSRRRWKCL